MAVALIIANISLIVFVVALATLISQQRLSDMLNNLKEYIPEDVLNKANKKSKAFSNASLIWVVLGLVAFVVSAIYLGGQIQEAMKPSVLHLRGY